MKRRIKLGQSWADNWMQHAFNAADLMQSYIDIISEKLLESRPDGCTLDEIAQLLRAVERVKPKGIEERAAYFILKELLFEELTEKLKKK